MALLLICACLLTACGSQQTEQDKLILLEQEKEEVQYDLAVVTVGDVVKSKSLSCEYRELASVDLAFPMSGKAIKKVYVQKGDAVTKGQLLAELEIGDVDSKIRDLEYRIAKNNLLLTHLDENENNEISSMWVNYIYQSNKSDEKEEDLREAVAALQQENEYTREDYRDAIALDTLELEQIRELVAKSRLYAEMDGTVSYVKADLEGTTSKADVRIISIIDGTEGLFAAEGAEYASYFTEGQEVTLTMTAGGNTYQLLPYQMEEWGEALLFTLADSDLTDSVSVQVGDRGTLQVVLERREQVLNVPTKSVYTAEGKDYVYVLGEENMREIRWIETGLYGDSCVEVLSGLTAGEEVIIK